MDSNTLLNILKSSIDLSQKYVISFIFSQITHGASSAISHLDEQLLFDLIATSFNALQAVEDKSSAEGGIDVSGVAIPFCEEMISLLFHYQRQQKQKDVNEKFSEPLNRFAKYLSSMRDHLHRKSHLSVLKEMNAEKIQPALFEDWVEKVEQEANFSTSFPAPVIVNALNSNQLPLFQAAAAAQLQTSTTDTKIDSLCSINLGSLYETAVLPSCCNFLREGRALAAAEVLTNVGRDAVTELTQIAEKSFNWHISENAICFLGEIGYLPPADAVSIFSTLAGCLSNCPCEQNGIIPAFCGGTGEFAASQLDPVLKFYYQKQNSDKQFHLVTHSCGPVPFPFAWIQQLNAFERRQIVSACHALKGVHSVTPSELVSHDDLYLLVAKANFTKFLQLVKTHQPSLVEFLIRTNSSKPMVPSFFKNKCLHAVDMVSLEHKRTVESLVDALGFNKTAQLIACSTSPSCEHLTHRFSGVKNGNGILSQIAEMCCQKNYVNLFLALCLNSSLKFAGIVAERAEKPVWAQFFEKSREYLVGDSGNGRVLDDNFVEECIRFAGGHSLIAEQLYAHFMRQLSNVPPVNSEIESQASLSKYSGFLSSLFYDKQDLKLEDSRLLYTILRSNMVFDVTKLFRFQSANYLATEEADECMAEAFTGDNDFPPSFLRTSIAAVPAQKQSSISTRRLKRPEPVPFIGFGRPLRAVLQHILSSGNYSSAVLNRRRNQIEEKVFNLAIENADSAPIVAGCLLFLNALGFSAERLQCAICILRLLTNNQSGSPRDSSFSSGSHGSPSSPVTTSPSPVPYSPVTFCKLAFSKRDRYAAELESICLNELAAINYDLYGSVSTLAVLDRLCDDNAAAQGLRPAWSRLLMSLATSNNWLSFFTYAEVLQIEPDDVLQLAAWFSDPHLKSHVMKTARGIATSSSIPAGSTTGGENRTVTPTGTGEKQPPARRRRRRAGDKKTEDSDSDVETRKDAKKGVEKQSSEAVASPQLNGVRRLRKTSSVIYQREQDLLSVVLQVSTASKANNDDEDFFDEFIDSVYRSKNPVCAIYAACLPRADRLACLVAYFQCYYPDIIAPNNSPSTPESSASRHHLPATSNPSFGDSPILNTLATAIDRLSAKRAYKTLFDGFSILLPSCPLSKLFKSAVSLTNQQSIDEFKSDLNQFTLAVEFYDPQLICPELQVEAVAAIAGQFLARLLYLAETISLYLIKLLDVYCECRIVDVVTWPLRLSPKQLLGLANQMVSAPDDGISEAGTDRLQQQPIEKLLGDDVETVNWSLIGELQARGQYIRARLVGQLLGISLSEILLKEFRHRYGRLTVDSNPPLIEKLIEYWRTFTDARRQSVTAMTISNEMLLGFLQGLLDESCKSPLEKALVAYEIARLSANSNEGDVWVPKTNIFNTFYTNFLQFYCDMMPEIGGTGETSRLPPSPASILFDKYFENAFSLSKRSTSGNRLLHCRYDMVDQTTSGGSSAGSSKQLPTLAASETGQLALRVLLDDLLDHGYIADALLLNKVVGNRSTDLLIVKQCTDLVWGRMGVAELPPPYSSCATVAQAMERMATDCKSMRTHIERLRLYHSISIECSLPYAQAESLPALTLFDHLLRRATYNALNLIGKLARSGDMIASEDYAILVCQYVLRFWTTDFDIVSSAATDRPVGLDEMANRLFLLCPDQTVLGNQLVNGVSQLLNGPGRGFHELSAAVDILIHAHNAFATTNNVDGIASVLHIARSLSRELETSSSDSHLQLLVKMLHNIGRYGEMSYILDVLYRSQKLPLVFQLKPRPDCEAQFRTSVLEFLRGVSGQMSSTQPDLYRHVCLQYGMEREVAQLLYDSATSQVADLGRLANTTDLSTWASEANSSLASIAQKFVDAAKGFAKAECPNQADTCIRQARLLALQIRFLSEGAFSVASTPVSVQAQQPNQMQNVAVAGGTSRQPNAFIVIGRTNPDVIREIIIQQSVAFECLIISEAYKVDCWVEAVFRQVIISAKNARYFHDLMAFYTLTDRFFEELVDLTERYVSQQQQQGGWTAQQAGRLKRVLHYCPDWIVQYRLAGRMGFGDLQTELINSQATPLIKDLIASNQLAPPSKLASQA